MRRHLLALCSGTLVSPTDVDYRLDTSAARSLLAGYVTLP